MYYSYKKMLIQTAEMKAKKQKKEARDLAKKKRSEIDAGENSVERDEQGRFKSAL